MDIDTKSGLELEQYVGIFGFGRLAGKAATGVVHVTVNVANTTDNTFALGTQFYSKSGLASTVSTIFYSSTQAVVLTAGNLSCDIPVQCTTVGSAGNLPPDSITYTGDLIGGSTVTNLTAMSGGVDIETDAELRQRFKDTLLRNVAGTSDFYEAICQQNNAVSRVVVFGPISLYQTQIAVPSTELVLPVTEDVKYAWCLVPETKVLTERLDWVPVGSLIAGDKLIGFDEAQPSGVGKKRAWRQSKVIETSRFEASVFDVCTSVPGGLGPVVRCTAEHMWLVSRRGPLNKGKKRGVIRSEINGRGQWVKTKDLVPGDKIRHIPTWKMDDSFEAGYLSGIFDGEGSLPHGTGCVDVAQNPGLVFDRIISALKHYEFNSLKIYDKSQSKSSRSTNPQCKQIVINGGVEEMMRFYGTFKPVRLLSRFLQKLYGSAILGGGTGIVKGARYAEVTSVTPAGSAEVVALGTSTKTLVAEGLLSHNSSMEAVFSNLGQEDETFYSPVDDYTFVGGASPTFTTVSTGALTVGDVVDLEFQYTTRSSRNDPANGITNKVDIFVDGVNPVSVEEKSVVSASVLSSTSSDPLFTGNFERVGSTGSPTAGNRFMRLGSTPVVSFPPTLTIGGVVYSLGTHYHRLQDTTLLRGTQVETSGIEWTSAGPTTGTEVDMTYVYNQVPELLNAVLASSKQICTDVMVHQADYTYIQPCFDIEYSRTFSVSVVNAQIIQALQNYFSTLPFGSQIKLNTLCMIVQQVLGVVDCKITTSSENPSNYGVQLFDNSTDTVPALVETSDFKLADNQLAVYQGALLTRVATP